MTEPFLEVSGLTRLFGGLRAVNAVDFTVARGEIVGLIGPNGAGKTTLFNMLGGAIPPSSGSIRFEQQECVGLPPHSMARRGVTRTFQITSVFPSLSVLENVKTGVYRVMSGSLLDALLRSARWRSNEAETASKAHRILEFLAMSHQAEERASALPYGDQRKLEIAIALAGEPKLLLLDEPAAGMSPEEGTRLIETIRSIRDSGVTVLIVEHHMRVVMSICDRLIVLDHGTKIADGPPKAVASDPKVVEVYLGKGVVHA